MSIATWVDSMNVRIRLDQLDEVFDLVSEGFSNGIIPIPNFCLELEEQFYAIKDFAGMEQFFGWHATRSDGFLTVSKLNHGSVNKTDIKIFITIAPFVEAGGHLRVEDEYLDYLQLDYDGDRVHLSGEAYLF